MIESEPSPSKKGASGHANGLLAETIKQMRSHRTSHDLAQTLLGGFALQGTLVVTGVILARALGPEDRGELALLILVGAITLLLVALGLPFALANGVARVPGRALEIIRGVRKPLWIRLAISPIIAGAVLAVLCIGKPAQVWLGAAVVTLAVAPGILHQCGIGILQGLHQFRAFNLLRVAPNAAFAGAALSLIVVGQAELMQLTLAWGVCQAAFGPVAMKKAHGASVAAHKVNSADPPATGWLLRFGRRSMLGATPLVETYRIDQAVVALFLAPVSLGLYVVALAFTNLPRFIAQSVGMVANPLVASSPTHRQARRKMWRFSLIAVPLYLPVIIVIWIAVPDLTIFFFGKAFASSAALSRLLLISTAIFCARVVLTDAARGAGYPMAGTIAEVIALASAILFFAIFVPSSGTDGVAYAMIASAAVALAILIGVLLLSATKRTLPSGWFSTLDPADPQAIPKPSFSDGRRRSSEVPEFEDSFPSAIPGSQDS
jgi:O-antigen/teichoic acid export membrane protein